MATFEEIGQKQDNVGRMPNRTEATLDRIIRSAGCRIEKAMPVEKITELTELSKLLGKWTITNGGVLPNTQDRHK